MCLVFVNKISDEYIYLACLRINLVENDRDAILKNVVLINTFNIVCPN